MYSAFRSEDTEALALVQTCGFFLPYLHTCSAKLHQWPLFGSQLAKTLSDIAGAGFYNSDILPVSQVAVCEFVRTCCRIYSF